MGVMSADSTTSAGTPQRPLGGQMFLTADSQCHPCCESGWSEAAIIPGNGNSGCLLPKDVGLAPASVFRPTIGVEQRRGRRKSVLVQKTGQPQT